MYTGQSIFWYNAPFRDLLRSSNGSFALQTQSDADFECQYLMANACTSLVDLSVDTVENILEGRHFTGILLQIVEENNGQQWFSEPTSVASVCGTAQNPLVLPQTKLISRSSTLNVSLTNRYSAVDFALVNITFFGRKLYT